MFSHNSPYKKGDKMSSSDKTKKALQSLGLTDYEARAYLSLVEFGLLTANEVSGNSNVPYSKSHTVLSGLEAKGWITVEPGRPGRYKARPPTDALEASRSQLLGRMKIQEDQVISELTPLYEGRSDREKPDIWIIRGEMNILRKLREITNKAQREIMISLPAVSKELVQLLGVSLMRLQGSSIKVTVMSTRDMEEDVKSMAAFANIRVRDKMYGGGVIVDERDTMLFIGEENKPKEIFAIWSDHVGLTRLAKDYFQYIWNSSDTLKT
ncbi:hypothetical protein A3K70_01840 [Candidatus Bathyarchaeota archaeon RBG_16_48_13]|nr:MAG: hypothetical protein A3K70_01840 [Candidatus Bathyarchaeota archaeon RBG_16_48_13]